MKDTPESVARVAAEMRAMADHIHASRPTTKQSELRRWADRLEALTPTPQAAPAHSLSDNYIQTVPDKCDRIIWRGHYYHLPFATHPARSDAAPVAWTVVDEGSL